MPVFMIALLALAVFSAIGVLLLTAVILEHRKIERHTTELQAAATPNGKQ